LDRNLAVVTKVVRQIHVRHAAGADLSLDSVAIRQGRLQTIERFHSRGQGILPSFLCYLEDQWKPPFCSTLTELSSTASISMCSPGVRRSKPKASTCPYGACTARSA